MGIGLFSHWSASTYDTPKRKCNLPDSPGSLYERQPHNPDPNNFVIIRTEQIGRFLLLLVQYPDCTNYEGKKILMYIGITLEDIFKQGHIDPHFSNNKKFHSPIARFIPDNIGWNMARSTAISLMKEVP